MDIQSLFDQYSVAALFYSGGPENTLSHGRFRVRFMAGEESVPVSEVNHVTEPLMVAVCYEWKDCIEKLHSRKPDPFGWPLLHITKAALDIHEPGWQPTLRDIPAISLENVQSKADYMEAVNAIKRHIQRGDVYEMNYCTELRAEGVRINPVHIFENICLKAPSPFSVLYKWRHLWLLCASPERFLARRGRRLISQPIKGTAPRHSRESDDRLSAENLRNSPKERMENTMIVDLVRNDLSRVCRPGSVAVPEWCGIYSFSHVHQMVSTVEGDAEPDQSFESILKAAFPPGSMTGAPKIRAMELAEAYEISRRGLYSGCVGYREGDGDFDLNVVIRSLIYNEHTGYLSCHVGSAITHLSDPEREWEECRWKAAGIRQALSR